MTLTPHMRTNGHINLTKVRRCVPLPATFAGMQRAGVWQLEVEAHANQVVPQPRKGRPLHWRRRSVKVREDPSFFLPAPGDKIDVGVQKSTDGPLSDMLPGAQRHDTRASDQQLVVQNPCSVFDQPRVYVDGVQQGVVAKLSC